MIDLKLAHSFSYGNREDVKKSVNCGCFFCECVFPSTDVTKFCREIGYNHSTAVCPRCGVDSVIGDVSCALTVNFLKKMHERWFGIFTRPKTMEWL